MLDIHASLLYVLNDWASLQPLRMGESRSVRAHLPSLRSELTSDVPSFLFSLTRPTTNIHVARQASRSSSPSEFSQVYISMAMKPPRINPPSPKDVHFDRDHSFLERTYRGKRWAFIRSNRDSGVETFRKQGASVMGSQPEATLTARASPTVQR